MIRTLALVSALAAALAGFTGAGSLAAQDRPAAETEIVEMALGDPDAPLTVIEYASFTCPHCATFHETVLPRLKTDYVDTGKIRFVHREVYFDRPGLWAGMVARCGGETRYFGVADRIYETQATWTAGQDPAAIVEALRRIGRGAGMSDAQLDSCLTDAAKAEALYGWYQHNVAEHGIEGTPSFVIDGQTYGNMSYDEMATILDEKLDADG